jgi:hypothetical protein
LLMPDGNWTRACTRNHRTHCPPESTFIHGNPPLCKEKPADLGITLRCQVGGWFWYLVTSLRPALNSQVAGHDLRCNGGGHSFSEHAGRSALDEVCERAIVHLLLRDLVCGILDS